MEFVILVDQNDNPIGTMEKLEAHRKGELHRAFSIIIFNDKNEIMLQKRAAKKYHSGGLWTNTCCSHPRPNEATKDAAIRRLPEEMGFSTDLKEIGTMTYKASFPNGMTEHEFLHLFIGKFNDVPKINPEEADDWKWIPIRDLKEDILTHPENYTYWFKAQFPKVLEAIQQ